jgi:hypothetical protein
LAGKEFETLQGLAAVSFMQGTEPALKN